MKFVFQATLSIGLLALCLATSPVRWCTTSAPEQEKCHKLQTCVTSQQLGCVRKATVHDCIKAIANSEADAVTVDGGHAFDAGQAPYNLAPFAAEVYNTAHGESVTSYYAVAVVKKDTIPSIFDLRGTKSCHTGLGKSAGWNVPMGRLIELKQIDWEGAATEPAEKAVARFFSASCVPGSSEKNLCRLCADPSKCSRNDAFSGYSGAFECMRSGNGDVAFVKGITALDLSPEEREKYELLCSDGTKKSVDRVVECNLASVPSHVVVGRSVDGRADEIWALLSTALERRDRPECRLFGPPEGILKDLMFKDSAVGLRRVPKAMDMRMFLGYQYYTSIQSLRIERADPDTSERIVWCAVGKAEKTKCDFWSGIDQGKIDCAVAETTEECIEMIMKGDADAISLDGGHIYTAGKCGLVPVLAEVYSSEGDVCSHPERETTVKGYSAVAVVKASDPSITWHNLKGKKSCHTAVGRTAGWNIPMGWIYKENNNSCAFDKFFSASCAPGAPVDSSLCSLCKGSGGEGSISEKNKCAANSNEIYYGYKGAARCLIETGDVAFIKPDVISEITGPNKPSWVGSMGPDDFRLLCPNGERRPVSDYANCKLADVAPHGVVARPGRAAAVRTALLDQQKRFGVFGTEKDVFQMFQSESKDSLFKDGTQCLATPKEKTYGAYLGKQYMDAMAGFKECSPSELLKACMFHQNN